MKKSELEEICEKQNALLQEAATEIDRLRRELNELEIRARSQAGQLQEQQRLLKEQEAFHQAETTRMKKIFEDSCRTLEAALTEKLDNLEQEILSQLEPKLKEYAIGKLKETEDSEKALKEFVDNLMSDLEESLPG